MRYKLRKHVAGFTLIEVLIASILLGMILLLLFNNLYATGKHWRRSEARIEKTDEVRHATRIIRDTLNQTVPLVWLDASGKRLAFQGNNEVIHFVAPLPAHRGGGGLSLVTFQLNTHSGQKGLYLYHRPATPDGQSFDIVSVSDEDRILLMKKISQIEFKYFGRETATSKPDWYDIWLHGERLPELIKVKFENGQDELELPEMIIRLNVMAENGQPQFQQSKTSTDG